MGDRYDLLDRLVAALAVPGVDGVLGSPDVIEDLLLLGALDDKVVFGSMNRGGLAGAAFEYDDRFTGYSAASVARLGLDGGKMLLRINLEDPATADTLSACAGAISALAAAGKVAMVEPFMSRRVDGRAVSDLSTEAIMRSMAIASALGADLVAHLAQGPGDRRHGAGRGRDDAAARPPRRARAATGPTRCSRAGSARCALPGVRGLVVGRNLLYPKDDDVVAAVKTAASLL